MLSVKEIKKIIDNDNASVKKRNARKGADYYEGRHDILDYRIFYYNSDGNLVEDKYRSNVKIPHPFFTELADQAVQYIFSGERFVLSDNTALQSELDNYFNFNDEFRAELSETLTGCITKGYEYMYAYKGADNKTYFMCADSLGVIEVRSRETDRECEYIIYRYADRTENNKKIERIQVWDKEQVGYFISVDGNIVPDNEAVPNPSPHILYMKDGTAYYDSYGVIPFFRLDNNKKQISGLTPIKPLIDDYDLMASSLSNNLIDFDTPLYAIKGFEGDNLDELQQNLKSKKMIGLDNDGGVEIKTVDVPYQARQTKLELDEKNIYRFGMGLNTAGLKDTTATTNVAIKAAYSLLDLKCAMLETRLKRFLRSIVSLILDEINKEQSTGYELSDVYFEFEHNIMSNALENAQIKQTEANARAAAVSTLLSLADTLDDQTIKEQICAALDIEYEGIKKRLTKNNETEKNIEEAVKTLTALNGTQTTSLLSIISQYKSGVLSSDEAASLISISFGVSEEKAREIMHIDILNGDLNE